MMYKLNTKIISGALIGCLALVLCIMSFGASVFNFFSLKTLQCYAGYLFAFAQAHYYLTIVLYLVIGIVGVTLFLPIVTLYMITAGFLFGPWQGALYAAIAVTLGAIGAFLVIRATVGPWVQKYEQKLVTINHFIKLYGFYALTVLRMLHLVPFFLINIAAALMPISLLTFASSTFIGVIPGSLLFAWTGQYLCTINSVWDLINMQTIIIGVCVIALLMGIALLGSYVMRRQKI